MVEWSAIVLAGGRGSRLGGVEKADLQIEGRSLLQHILEGLAVPTIVVGPERDVDAENVRFVLEEPRFGGPIAGLRAAIDTVETSVVAVLAVDMPFAISVVKELVELWRPDAEVLVPSRDGHDQYVCSVFSAPALRRGLASCGDSMKSLFAFLNVTRIEMNGDQSLALRDIDTIEDLELLKSDPLR